MRVGATFVLQMLIRDFIVPNIPVELGHMLWASNRDQINMQGDLHLTGPTFDVLDAPLHSLEIPKQVIDALSKAKTETRSPINMNSSPYDDIKDDFSDQSITESKNVQPASHENNALSGLRSIASKAKLLSGASFFSTRGQGASVEEAINVRMVSIIVITVCRLWHAIYIIH